MQEKDKIILNPQQKNGLKLATSRKNVFITGSAGTGKSLLVGEIIKKLPFSVVTGSTGVAAVNVEGRTLHSFLGIGLGEGTWRDWYFTSRHKKWLISKIKKCKTLIIDEVSMLSGDFLDNVNLYLKKIKSSDSPFGGIQMVLCGDFAQLPPVKYDPENPREMKMFAFQADAWKEANFQTIYLKEIYRQEDKEYVNILQKIRMGEVDDSVIDTLEERVGKKCESTVPPVEIYTTNRQVDEINKKRLNAIFSETRIFNSIDFGSQSNLSLLDRNCPASKTIVLKVGASVMVLSNIDVSEGLVNGAIGIVSGFAGNGDPIVMLKNGKVHTIPKDTWEIKEGTKSVDEEGEEITLRTTVASRTQVPLKIAFCSTIHKTQGVTLDLAKMDLSNCFEYGQTYVALSRVKNLEGLFLDGIDFDKIKAHPDVVKYYKEIENV